MALLVGGRLRVVAAILAFVVGWFGSLFVASWAEWEPHAFSTADVRCPVSPATGRALDYCERDELLYEIFSIPWPPIKAYAVGVAVLLGGAVLLLSRPRPVERESAALAESSSSESDSDAD